MNRLEGSVVDFVTPMREDRTIDSQAFAEFIEWQIQAGTQGICVAGSIGESIVLAPDEYSEVCRVAVESAKGRLPVLAGYKGASTLEVIEFAQIAKKAGVAGMIHSVPADVGTNPDLVLRHYTRVAESVDLPILVSTQVVDSDVRISVSLILHLSEIAQITGVIDETGDVLWLSEILRRRPKDFRVYSGVGAAAAPFMLLGADGVIATSGNIAPRHLAQLCAAVRSGDAARVSEIHLRLFPLYSGVFSQANPSLIKWAQHLLEVVQPFARLQTLPTPMERREVARALEQVGLLIPSAVLPT